MNNECRRCKKFAMMQEQPMSSSIDTVALDPRIRRTRRSLQDALEKLLSEKDFDEISVHDISETATLNRATFYDHYTDKFALLECTVAWAIFGAAKEWLRTPNRVSVDRIASAIELMVTPIFSAAASHKAGSNNR